MSRTNWWKLQTSRRECVYSIFRGPAASTASTASANTDARPPPNDRQMHDGRQTSSLTRRRSTPDVHAIPKTRAERILQLKLLHNSYGPICQLSLYRKFHRSKKRGMLIFQIPRANMKISSTPYCPFRPPVCYERSLPTPPSPAIAQSSADPRKPTNQGTTC